jgi:hypothetical protein
MNDGVALLLERMKTHPEEFGVRDAKWSSLINSYIMHLEKEDRDALNEGMDKLMQQRFTQKVMEELIDPKFENPYPYLTESVIRLGAQTPIQYTADKLETLGQTPIAGVTQTL